VKNINVTRGRKGFKFGQKSVMYYLNGPKDVMVAKSSVKVVTLSFDEEIMTLLLQNIDDDVATKAMTWKAN